MYCINCGKLISDQARFCNYCGVPVSEYQAAESPSNNSALAEQAVSEQIPMSEPVSAESAPVSAPIEGETGAPVSQSYSAPVTSAYQTYSNAEQEGVPAGNVSSVIDQDEQQAPVFNESAPLPTDFTPNTISTRGSVLPQSVKIDPPKERPERKYTLGHIMMCLAAVAVMAIVAGVFAGLYFSVV